MRYKNIILGAGASGLMSAVWLKDRDSTLILEANPKAGAKILISGGGKCNITNRNISPKDYRGDWRFIKAVIKRFDNRALIRWLESKGLKPIMKKDAQYFCPNSAKEILDILLKSKPTIHYNRRVDRVEKRGDEFVIYCSKDRYFCDNLIVALGGEAYPKIGGSSKGLEIAKSFGHTITPTAPALTGFTLQKEQFFMKELSGISIFVRVKVANKEIEGNLLFAHRGISGPAIYDASLWWERGAIEIDFIPKLELNSIRGSKKLLSSSLNIPKRVAKALIASIGLEDKSCNRLTQDEFKRLQTLKEYRLAPAGRFGYSRAEVMRGGVATDEIDSKSMESKLVDNLYFVGEVLDVTGRVGGYNFQWAFSSAKVCADSVR